MVALTGRLFEGSAVGHDDAASALFNQASGLKGAQNNADRGALNAKPLGQCFMGQGQGVLVHPVMDAEKPAAAPGLDRVKGIAGHGVKCLGEQCLVESGYHPSQPGAQHENPAHLLDRNPRGGARDQHHRASEGFTADKGAQETEHPLTPEQRHFGHAPIFHDFDKGHDGIVREVGVANAVASLVEHCALR